MSDIRRVFVIGALAGIVACTTEQEVLENGVETGEPNAVQEAPTAPVPEPIAPALPYDSLEPAPMDSTGLEDV